MPNTIELHGLLSRTIDLEVVSPVLAEEGPEFTVCLVRVDSSWRLTDRNAFDALGWEARARLLIRLRGGALVVRAGFKPRAGERPLRLDGRGRLSVPRDLRQALRLRAGEELLLTTRDEQLVLIPARALLSPLLAELD